MGLILNVLQSIYLGALCVLMTPVGFVHRPLEWLRAIHHYRGEVAAAPNFAFDLCVDRFRPDQMHGIDLSSWKIACNGAEPIRMETMRRFADTFAPYGFAADTLYPAYGLAEATLFVSGGHRGRGVVSRTASSRALQDGRIEQPTGPNDERRLVGCGRPANGLTVAIVDPTRKRQVAPDVIGEIWITGPSVARGYWGRAETSAAVFRAELDGARGGAWLRTGDLGCVDAQGELYVTGRLKDVIIIRGANHYPQDIEATVARSHPALRRDCGAAFSVADGNGDEKLVVVQEVKRGWRGVVTVEDIVASIRAALANEHEVMARTVVLIEAATIPKTTSGKLQRTLTAKQWAEGKLTLWSGPQPPAADTVTSADL
jgi:acyl-CoA synthetase (AMP-forming)/AMP-acid ligase II